MSWNEPSNNNNKDNGQDPWSKKQEGPPGLDELFRDLQNKLSGQFGGSGGSAPPAGSGGGSIGLGFMAAILLVVYLISGIYIVQPAERAVITRFGHYLETAGPGPHWMPRFVDQKTIVNVEEVHTTEEGGLMLTKDENIVDVRLAVQYRIIEPADYLFKVSHPERSLQQVVNSALRYVVGHNVLDSVLTRGRSEVAAAIRAQVVEVMEYYGTGLQIVEVAMQPATPPEEVKSAFDDVIRAQEDEQRLVNEADAYARKIEPIAQGKAQRLLEEADAYQKEVSLLAQGEVARFLALLPEYKNMPSIMRDRLYLKTMSEVLANTPKVLVDTDAGNLMYLPLDKLMQGAGSAIQREDEDGQRLTRKPRRSAQAQPQQSARQYTRRTRGD